jgi:two-component system sensor histidine kinase YesM
MDMARTDRKQVAGQASRNRFSGIGMQNVQERLQMYYGSEYGLSVHSIPGEGTTVTLTLPMRQAAEGGNGEGGTEG